MSIDTWTWFPMYFWDVGRVFSFPEYNNEVWDDASPVKGINPHACVWSSFLRNIGCLLFLTELTNSRFRYRSFFNRLLYWRFHDPVSFSCWGRRHSLLLTDVRKTHIIWRVHWYLSIAVVVILSLEGKEILGKNKHNLVRADWTGKSVFW